MALPLLRFPSCNNPLLSASFAACFSLPSSSRIPCSPSRGGGVPLLHRGLSAFAALSSSSSSSTAEAVEATTESSGAARTRLIAQNIPWTCTSDDITALFAKHGTVVDVEMSMYTKSRNRGLAFVTMASEEEALAALNQLNSSNLDGRVINVQFARSKKKTPVETAAPVSKYNVFVGNITGKVRSHDLREFFSSSGNVLSAEVIYQSNPRRPRGYGFVSFASKEEAEAAITNLNGKILMGRAVRLAFGRVHADDAEKKLDMSERSNEVDASTEQPEQDVA